MLLNTYSAAAHQNIDIIDICCDGVKAGLRSLCPKSSSSSFSLASFTFSSFLLTINPITLAIPKILQFSTSLSLSLSAQCSQRHHECLRHYGCSWVRDTVHLHLADIVRPAGQTVHSLGALHPLHCCVTTLR
jgi:hypothetical protein